MSLPISRGALIVFEGCDRSGKSTQCKKLVDALTSDGIKAKLWRFPGMDYCFETNQWQSRDTGVGVRMCRVLLYNLLTATFIDCNANLKDPY